MLLTFPLLSPLHSGVYYLWRFSPAYHSHWDSPDFPARLPRASLILSMEFGGFLSTRGPFQHDPYACPCHCPCFWEAAITVPKHMASFPKLCFCVFQFGATGHCCPLFQIPGNSVLPAPTSLRLFSWTWPLASGVQWSPFCLLLWQVHYSSITVSVFPYTQLLGCGFSKLLVLVPCSCSYLGDTGIFVELLIMASYWLDCVEFLINPKALWIFFSFLFLVRCFYGALRVSRWSFFTHQKMVYWTR